MKYRLAVLASHPIQYQAPLWRLLAAEPDIELTVFFESDLGVGAPAYDPEFGRAIQWDTPLLEGYHFEFLKESADTAGFLRHLAAHDFDALLVHNWNRPLSWRALRAAHRAGTKVLLRTESPWNQERIKSAPERFLKRMLLRRFFARVDAFLAIGKENRAFYLHYGIPEQKIFNTPYAVDNTRFMASAMHLLARKEELRAKLGIAPGAAMVLFAGKLIEKKRPLDLLAAYARCVSAATPEPETAPTVPPQVGQAALVFVGEGALQPQLQAAVAAQHIPNVFFAGFKNQTEIPEYYAAADVLVLPSGRGETWGLVVNEAMCFSLPIIVSDVVGCGADLVHGDENGYVVPLGDVAQLAAALQKLIQDPERRRAFGAHSFQIVQAYDFMNDIRGIKAALAAH